MKKLITLIMLMSFVTVQANAVSPNGLELAFKEFSFTLSQIDIENNKTEFQEATLKMNEAVAAAYAAGMTNEELIGFATDRIVDPSAKASFELVLAKVNLQNISSNQTRKLVIEALENSYAQGAQWSPEATYATIAVLVLAAAVVAIASGSGSSSRGAGTAPGSYCREEAVCYEYQLKQLSANVLPIEDCYFDWVCYNNAK